MANDKRITGAVGFGGRVYRAGQEKEFEAALKTEAGKHVDLARLTREGHLAGYASGEVAPASAAENKQLTADGSEAASGKKKSGKKEK